jgi:hypothetical protein
VLYRQKTSNKEFKLEKTEEQNTIHEAEFFIAVERYKASWISTETSNVLGYGIDKQIQLPSGKIQVIFSTVETLPDQDEDDDNTYGYRVVCVVACDASKGRGYRGT